MVKTPRKDFNVPVERPGHRTVNLPITAPDSETAKKLADRIAKSRGWKTARVGKPEEEKS